MANIERGSQKALLEAIDSKIDSLTTVGAVELQAPSGVTVDSTSLFLLPLSNVDGTPVSSSNMVPGSHTISRIRAGVPTELVTATTNVPSYGGTYFTYDFPSAGASWAPSDLFYATFTDVVRTTSSGGSSAQSPYLQYGQVLPSTDVSVMVTNIYNILTDSTIGSSATKDRLVDLATTTSSIAAVIASSITNYLSSHSGSFSSVQAELANATYGLAQLANDHSSLATTAAVLAAHLVTDGNISGVQSDVDLIHAKTDRMTFDTDSTTALKAYLYSSVDVLASSFAPWAAFMVGQELLSNGNAENTYSGGISSGWNGTDPALTLSSDETTPFQGAVAQKAVQSSLGGGYGLVSPSVQIVNGERYLLHYAVRTNEGEGSSVAYVYFGLSGHYTTLQSSRVAALGSWDEGTVLYKADVTSSLARFRFGFRAASSGSISADALSVRPITTSSNSIYDRIAALNNLSSAQIDTAVAAALNSSVTSAPTNNSLQDILHKDGSYTYDNTTDSLEALRDDLDLIGSSIHSHINTPSFPRNYICYWPITPVTLSSVNQIIGEVSSTSVNHRSTWKDRQPVSFLTVAIDISGASAYITGTATMTFNGYLRCSSGTASTDYVKVWTHIEPAGAPTFPMLFVALNKNESAGERNPASPGIMGYDIKVTAMQSTIAGGWYTPKVYVMGELTSTY